MKILVGSQALAHHLNLKREPKDTDYFSDEIVSDRDTFTEVFWHPALAEWNWSGEVASLDELYTIKVSHSFWELRNGSWNKHMYDLVKMQEAGAKRIPELYTLLYKIWEEKHGKKKANLELSPDEFFNPNVNRKYVHDTIHESVAYYQEEGPLFNRILRDGHEVAVDRSKFEAMTDEDKNRLVREEVYATALERRLIPENFRLHPRVAYDFALRRTITSFSKGWFPLYIVENYGELRKPDVDFVAVHKKNAHKLVLLQKGEI